MTEDVMIIASIPQANIERMEVLAEHMECDVATLFKAIVLHFEVQLSIALQIDTTVLVPAMLAQLSLHIN